MNIIEVIAGELQLKEKQVEQTVALIDEGNTIPFIACLLYTSDAADEL